MNLAKEVGNARNALMLMTKLAEVNEQIEIQKMLYPKMIAEILTYFESLKVAESQAKVPAEL